MSQIRFEAPKNSVSELKCHDAPSGRYGHRAVLYKNRLIIFGGYNGSRRLSEVFEYNTDSQMWKKVRSKGKSPGARDCHSAALYNDKMVIFGGGTGYRWMNDLYSYNINTKTWKKIRQKGHIPEGRAGHSSVVYNSKMYLFGGWNGFRTMNDLYEFDFKTNIWKKIDITTMKNAPKCRDSHCCVMYRDNMIVVGGGDGVKRLNDMFSYNITRGIWKKIEYSGFGFVGRAGHYLGYYPSSDRLVMFGGGDGTYWIQDIFEFDFKLNKWMVRDLSNCKSKIPGCYGCSGVIYKNKLILFGGGDGSNFYNTTYEVEIEREYQSRTQMTMFERVLKRNKFVDCIIECQS